MRDHYAALGLEPGAGPEEVKAAYRRLAKAHHPDVSTEPDARERFDAVREAYEALSDPGRKAAYDALLAERAARARRLTKEEKARREAEELARKAEERMRDVPRPAARDVEAEARLRMLMAAGRIAEAESLALSLIEREPRQAVAQAVLGDVARARGDLGTAARRYALAAQFAPDEPVYQRTYEQLLAAKPSGRNPDLSVASPGQDGVRASGVASFFVLCAAIYAAWSPERPLGWPLVPDWTVGLVATLAVAGVAVGAALSLTGTVQPLRLTRGSTVSPVSLGGALAALGLVSFWLTVAAYLLVGVRQGGFNRSLSAGFGSVAGVTACFGLVGCARSGEFGLQALLWGGNVAWLGALVAWAAVDALRRA